MTRSRLPAPLRRDLILDAADTTFGRLGFDATRMEDVAEAAGVAKGLLYRHFESKDALFEALLEREGAKFADSLRNSLVSADLSASPLAAIRAGVATWLELIDDEAPSFYFTDPGVHSAYEKMQLKARDVIAQVIAVFEPAGEPVYRRLIAAAVQGAAENVALVWRADPDGLSRDEAVELLSRFCWGGLDLLQQDLHEAGAANPAT